MIMDTCFIIDLMNNNPQAVAKLNELHKHHTPLMTTTLTLFELFTGVAQSTKKETEKQKINSILQGCAFASITETSAETSGYIHGNLMKEGTPINSVDALIAGITIEKNKKLLTRNTKDFSKINGLQIETY